MDWIHLAQDRDQWWALLNEFCKVMGISRVAKQLLASQGLSSVELRSDLFRMQRLIKI
jgi:hypothetical protein